MKPLYKCSPLTIVWIVSPAGLLRPRRARQEPVQPPVQLAGHPDQREH